MLLSPTSRPRNRAVVLGIALGLAACGGDSPAEPSAFDVVVELTNIFVVGDCESAPGNPGEFAWSARLRAPLGGYAVEETSGFPGEGGALPYSEDASPIVLAGYDLRIDDIAASDADDVELEFAVVEWDAGDHDPDMDFVQSFGPVPSPTDAVVPHAIDVGDSFSCLLSFEFVANWTAA